VISERAWQAVGLPSHPATYTVTHTSLVFVFNRRGTPEFMIAGFSSRDPDLKGIARDLAHVVSANRV